MKVYASSNKARRKEISAICKKYQELPPYIIKQIVDWKLSNNKPTLSEQVQKVRELNEDIFRITFAINESKYKENRVYNTLNPDALVMGHFSDGRSPLILQMSVFIKKNER